MSPHATASDSASRSRAAGSPRPGAARRARARGTPPGPVAFVVRFVLASLAGLAALAWLPAVMERAVDLTTRHAAALAGLLGEPLDVEGNVIEAGSLHLEIVAECTPMVPMVLLLAALFAYPAAWRHRGVGALLVIPALWIYNLFRVLGLVLVLASRPQWFEFIHVYVWQAVTLAVCGALFALWLRLGAALRSRAAGA